MGLPGDLGLGAALTLSFRGSILMAGILPFGAMFIELFFIFSVSTAVRVCPPFGHAASAAQAWASPHPVLCPILHARLQ